MIKFSDKNRQYLIKKMNNFLIDYFKIIVIVLSACVLLFSLLFIIYPKYQGASKQYGQVARNQEEIYEKRSRYLEQLRKLNNDFNNLDANNLKKIDELLPNNPDTGKLMSQLEIMVSRNGLNLISLNLTPENAAKDNKKTNTGSSFAKVRISLRLVGVDYNSMKNFLKEIEASLRIIDIQNLNFSPGDGSLSLEMEAYYLK